MQAYIEAPEEQKILSPSIFLAGGISGCPDWQTDAKNSLRQMLNDFGHTVINPRRSSFDINDKSTSRIQIEWEFRYLRLSDLVLFWFPCETLCPIALYELGAMSMDTKALVVGCHPQYQRLEDVQVQLELQRPGVKVHSNFEGLLVEAAEKLLTGRF